MKVLLLSDDTICANRGGLSQTLYNLFLFVDPQDMLCISSQHAFNESPPDEPYASRYIYFKFNLINFPKNRIYKLFSPLIDWFNFSFNNFKQFKEIKSKISEFNPDVIVTCPNGPLGIFMHYKLLSSFSNKKIFPYFMDDWMYHSKVKWIGGEIQNLIKKILSENSSWLIISEELLEILTDRYDAVPKHYLKVHNPVDITNSPEVKAVKKKQKFTLAYAGSLWQMHFDSFHAIAQAIYLIKDKYEIDLIVYTSNAFWNWRKHDLYPYKVIYGGNIPYNKIHYKLSEADALILCSSFLKELHNHSKGSVQTKITDYLKAKRLIISCGPSYSANHNFLKKYNCGICIETKDINEIAIQIDNILKHIEDYENYIINGFNVLKEEFSFSIIHKKLSHFLTETHNSAQNSNPS